MMILGNFDISYIESNIKEPLVAFFFCRMLGKLGL